MFDHRPVERSHGRRWVGFAAILMLGAILFTLAFMWLWNQLMPGLFGLRSIHFGQALGLLVLSRLLLGNPFRMLGQGLHRRHHLHMIERWENMTPEEREQFRHGLRDHHRRQQPRPDPRIPQD